MEGGGNNYAAKKNEIIMQRFVGFYQNTSNFILPSLLSALTMKQKNSNTKTMKQSKTKNLLKYNAKVNEDNKCDNKAWNK